MQDTIYSDLKEQGLVLSEPFEFGFPAIRAPKPNLFGQLASYIVSENNFEKEQFELIVVPILNNCFIVARCNTLLCYKYEIDKQTAKPVIARPNINHLKFKILKVHICDNKYLNDRGEIPFILESAASLSLYYVDLKESKIVERNSLSYRNCLSVRFICEKEFLVMTEKRQVHHIIIQSGKMKLKNAIKVTLEYEPDVEELCQIDILGNIDEEQQSTICMFYSLKGTAQESQKFKVKEFERDLDGRVTEKDNYTIISVQNSELLNGNYKIMSFDNYYCIVVKLEILILKKKFNRYLFIDNIMEKVGGNILKLHSNGIVTSHSGSSMEVNCILFNDPKCSSKLLDSIQIDPELSEGFQLVWPFKNQKETSLMFVFKKETRLVVFNLIKMDPNAKMLKMVEETPKEKIGVIQEIAVNLGINKKDFYLNQWVHSKRLLPDIYQFLLPCADIQSIKKELRMTMKRKKIEVSELLKILEKLGKIIKNELKEHLNQNTLREYIKNDFLLRKIKLKEACTRLDQREMEKIYNSSLIDMFVEIVKNDLYPSEKQLDPLHVMVEEEIRETTSLKHVFQEFRMMILENYKRFLISFISEFTPEQIVNVVDNYHFLLPIHRFAPKLIIHEPDYMTEVELNQMILKAEKTQPQWFSDMTSIEFARELSKERIEKELHDFYPNSKIHEAINSLVHSEYGVKEKLHKHGLISCTMLEYQHKLRDIEDIKLFLKVCEHVNQYNLDSDDPQDDLSVQLVQIFQAKNKLEGKAYETVRLYTSMHRFMLKHNFCEKKIVTAEELIQLTSEDLVALFFLENRQRKEFIFRQFRDLFVDLYGNPQEFNTVINKFINSENCSRIELEIFINEIKAKGADFQIDNQELIELIIDGFCKKLEIREDSDTCRFLEIMEDIELSKNLGMKINKIIQVRKCLGIFNVFNCEKESYFDILRYQENNQIFKILLDRYFNQNMKRDEIRIEDEEISLDFCRNMLTVLLYLQENVYYDITERELLLTYGEVLIEWKQFEVIKGILYDEEVLEKLEIESESFINELIMRALEQIYEDEEIIYDPETKEHIRNILEIYVEENGIRSQEFAKLEIVEIFEAWGTVIRSHDIYTVCEEWENNSESRREFILDVITDYIEYLDFEVFKEIYRYLEMATGKPSDEEDLYNEEFVSFSLSYADELLKIRKFDEILKILAFVKSMPEAKASYSLVSEAFLQCLSAQFPEEQDIESAKEKIEFFTQNFDIGDVICGVFETHLESAKFEYSSDRIDTIEVNSAFCFRKHKATITLDFLWDLCLSMPQEKQSRTQSLYYNYYFLIMAFRDPDHGLTKNHKISYSLEGITELLFRLESKIDDNSDLWAINTFSLFKKFKKSLYFEAILRIQAVRTLSLQDFKNDDTQIDAVKNILKEDKEKNSELIKCITRVENYLAAFKTVRKTEREIRFEKSKIQTGETVIEESKEEKNEEVVEQNNATLNLRKLREMKIEISNASQFLINQKDILEQIYERENEEKQANRRKNKVAKQGLGNFLQPLMSTAKQSILDDLERKIVREEYDSLGKYSKQDLVLAAQKVYNSGEKDFHAMIIALENMGISDERKINIGRMCKIYQGESSMPSTEDIKKLFPFSYFVEEPMLETEEEFKARTYNTMKHSFQELVSNVENEFIRTMANFIGSILGDSTYIARFYIDVIVILAQGRLDSETVVRIRIIMNILREYAPVVREYLTIILDAYKENEELVAIIKQELLTCLQDLKDDEAEDYIRSF